jgi:hypothetical protein
MTASARPNIIRPLCCTLESLTQDGEHANWRWIVQLS